MDTLKAATDWARAELFSTPFFILFGIVFMVASLGFWQLGKTDMAKAYIIPTLVRPMQESTPTISNYYQ